MSAGERQGKLWLFVGTNGTGKTTKLKQCLAMNTRNLIVTPSAHDKGFSAAKKLQSTRLAEPYECMRYKLDTVYPTLNRFTGNRKIFGYDKLDVYPVMDPERGFMCGGIFLDDFKGYVISKGQLPGIVDRFFKDRRHKELDIFMACHSWKEVNPEIFNYKPECWLFYTTRPVNDTPDMREKVINLDELIEKQNRVNEINRKLPELERFHFEYFKPA